MGEDDQITEIVEFIGGLLEHPNLKICVNLVRRGHSLCLGTVAGTRCDSCDKRTASGVLDNSRGESDD